MAVGLYPQAHAPALEHPATVAVRGEGMLPSGRLGGRECAQGASFQDGYAEQESGLKLEDPGRLSRGS